MLHHKYLFRAFIINFFITWRHLQTENQSCKTKLQLGTIFLDYQNTTKHSVSIEHYWHLQMTFTVTILNKLRKISCFGTFFSSSWQDKTRPSIDAWQALPRLRSTRFESRSDCQKYRIQELFVATLWVRVYSISVPRDRPDRHKQQTKPTMFRYVFIS
jgi:hypothetical protein